MLQRQKKKKEDKMRGIFSFIAAGIPARPESDFLIESPRLRTLCDLCMFTMPVST